MLTRGTQRGTRPTTASECASTRPRGDFRHDRRNRKNRCRGHGRTSHPASARHCTSALLIDARSPSTRHLCAFGALFQRLNGKVFALERKVFGLERKVFALNQMVFGLERRVFGLNQMAFALERKVFALNQTVRGQNARAQPTNPRARDHPPPSRVAGAASPCAGAAMKTLARAAPSQWHAEESAMPVPPAGPHRSHLVIEPPLFPSMHYSRWLPCTQIK